MDVFAVVWVELGERRQWRVAASSILLENEHEHNSYDGGNHEQDDDGDAAALARSFSTGCFEARRLVIELRVIDLIFSVTGHPLIF